MVFTSGTTGHPKAVVLTARGLGAFGDDLAEIFAADADSRVLHVAGPGFDMALLEMLLAGMSGARLVVAPGSAYGGPELTELIAAERVTHACLTPSVASSVAAGSFPNLATLMLGGERSPTMCRHGGVRGQALHRVRPGRGDGLRDVGGSTGPVRATADRTARPRHRCRRARSTPAACAAGGDRRAVPGR
ncbi:AMP-binding protein [Rhodococcus hoagii]|nr:AMP-binding protein [Prescottella equi]